MSWDKRAEAYARETGLSREAVMVAARWQRDQLFTDEAIERVAVEMAERFDRVPFDQMPKFIQDAWRADARAAFTALLGEEQ